MHGRVPFLYFFSSRRRHTRYWRDWSSDVCSSDLTVAPPAQVAPDRNIPDELAAVCLAALEKDPARRLPTVAAFAARIADYRRHAVAVELAAKGRGLQIGRASCRERGVDGGIGGRS